MTIEKIISDAFSKVKERLASSKRIPEEYNNIIDYIQAEVIQEVSKAAHEIKYSKSDLSKAINMARLINDTKDGCNFTAEDISGCTEISTIGWEFSYLDEEIIKKL